MTTFCQKQAYKIGTGLVVLLAGVGPMVPPCSTAVLEVVFQNKPVMGYLA